VAVNALQLTLLGGGEPRVNEHAQIERITLDNESWLLIARDWLLGADTLLHDLIECVDWKQGRRYMFERMLDDPRLSCHYARDDALPHPALAEIGARLDALLGVDLHGPGCNYYRDGRDSVAWHADRELRDLEDTRIAIVTLGAQRPFLLRGYDRRGKSRNLAPGSGDLLVMGGASQMHWQHAVPKTKHAGPRISCTWRATLEPA
jgi:alkylated DNA repair dioxygenase AlkB